MFLSQPLLDSNNTPREHTIRISDQSSQSASDKLLILVFVQSTRRGHAKADLSLRKEHMSKGIFPQVVTHFSCCRRVLNRQFGRICLKTYTNDTRTNLFKTFNKNCLKNIVYKNDFVIIFQICNFKFIEAKYEPMICQESVTASI